jgi:hypothetical protein
MKLISPISPLQMERYDITGIENYQAKGVVKD